MSKDRWSISRETLRTPVIMLLIFFGIGIWRTLATGKIFFLFSFGYIGAAIALGSFLNRALPKTHILWGRRISQLLIASYLLGYVGLTLRENMEIEGFFIHLLMGVFATATLHYFIAKVVGTFFLNRGWCGWACWTAMVLDLLPWRQPKEGRLRRWGAVRYVHFALSLVVVPFAAVFAFLVGYIVKSLPVARDILWNAGKSTFQSCRDIGSPGHLDPPGAGPTVGWAATPSVSLQLDCVLMSP